MILFHITFILALLELLNKKISVVITIGKIKFNLGYMLHWLALVYQLYLLSIAILEVIKYIKTLMV